MALIDDRRRLPPSPAAKLLRGSAELAAPAVAALSFGLLFAITFGIL